MPPMRRIGMKTATREVLMESTDAWHLVPAHVPSHALAGLVLGGLVVGVLTESCPQADAEADNYH